MKRYPNAADGISKLFLAEILGIIGAVASLIVVFFAATTVTSTIGGYVDGALGSLGLMAMLGAIVSILGIARLILSIISIPDREKIGRLQRADYNVYQRGKKILP